MGRAGMPARIGLPGIVLGIVLATSACVPSALRTAMHELSRQEPTYAGRWRPWFPWWYTLYSILPGRAEPACDTPSQMASRGPSRTTTIVSCVPASGDSLPDTAIVAGKTADAVEAAFQKKIRITRLGIRLVPPGARVFTHDSIFLRPRGLALEIVATFEPTNEEASRRKLARSMAHELFHMGKRALHPWRDLEGTVPPEEVAAALFESCIEDEVFGSISPSAMSQDGQSDPGPLARIPGAYRSAAGNLEATRRLAEVVGNDAAISSTARRNGFRALCAALAP